MGLSTTYTKAEIDYLLQNSGAESASGLIEVTYDELVDLKNTSGLVKGQNYLLTDYETTYIQPVTNVNKSSGVIEPLIITATDVDKLHNQCKSTLYPQDIVYYEITGDIGNERGTEGFTKGKIYRRIDTLRNNDIGTDWRHVKYDRDGIDKLLFQSYISVYNNKIKTYYLFNSVVGNNFINNTIGDRFESNTIGNGFENNMIGFNFNSNILGNGFKNNTIGNWFENNIVDGFQNNIIGNYFQNNTIGDSFITNTIGESFSNNTIRNYFQHNIIGNDFQNNTISNTFIYNTIVNSFQNNTIGYYFNNNIIGNTFYNNVIGNDFYYNIIGNDFSDNGNQTISFLSKNTEFKNNMSNITSTIEIQNVNIDVVVFKSPNGTKKQRYYNDSNNLVINNL